MDKELLTAQENKRKINFFFEDQNQTMQWSLVTATKVGSLAVSLTY